MTKKQLKLIYLIIAITLVVVGVVGLTIASIKSADYGKNNYYHNIKIKTITTDNVIDNDVVYHEVTLDGEIINNTNVDYGEISVEIVFNGVNNSTGTPAEYTSSFMIDEFDAKTKSDLTDKKLRIGNRSGYIPESIKEVRIILNGVIYPLEYEEVNELNLIIFALSLALIFISVLVFVKWKKINIGRVDTNN